MLRPLHGGTPCAQDLARTQGDEAGRLKTSAAPAQCAAPCDRQPIGPQTPSQSRIPHTMAITLHGRGRRSQPPDRPGPARPSESVLTTSSSSSLPPPLPLPAILCHSSGRPHFFPSPSRTSSASIRLPGLLSMAALLSCPSAAAARIRYHCHLRDSDHAGSQQKTIPKKASRNVFGANTRPQLNFSSSQTESRHLAF